MANIKIYSKDHCGYCLAAKRFFDSKGQEYTELRVDLDDKLMQEMRDITGGRTMPQIVIDDKVIGGFDDLKALDQKGELDEILNK